MLKHLMEALNVDRDGAVRRTEFDAPPMSPMVLSPNEREAIEVYLVNATEERFKFLDRQGRQGIVFYDDRGRAAAGVVSEMGDDLLLFLAEKQGYQYTHSAEPYPGVE